MKWHINRTLHAPAAALPVQERPWPAILTLSAPQLTLSPPAPGDDLSHTLGQMIGDPAFAVRWTAEPVWEALPPAPWQSLLTEMPPAPLISAHLGYGEIALTLRLLPLREWRQRQPLDPVELGAALQAGGLLPQRLREGFAFALFEPGGPWDREDELLSSWRQAVRATLHQRRPLAQALTPHSRWLVLGYRLLNRLSAQRAHRPTLAEVEAGWQTLPALDDPPLPQMFAVVYWGESAYRLLECGDTAGAALALGRQTAAAHALVALLPDLAEALDGGLWRHHLGQLAYYHGDFPQALQHFQQEWRLQAQRPASALHARLGRNLGSLLTDLGLLASARRLTEAGLIQQRRNDDPELFKTLGRLGEIQVRQGDYAAARAAYEESWQRQPAEQREGRTAIYLGHLALLENRLAEAETWYQTAAEADQAQGVAFNPYRVMGEMALAWRRDDHTGIQRLWREHREALDALGHEKVLPAAVAALTTAEPALAGQSVERLLENQYLLEALSILARWALPTAVAPWLERIAAGLQEWQQAVEAAIGDIGELDPHESTAPGPIAARIASALAANDWQPLAAVLAQTFPVNLLTPRSLGHWR